VKALLVTIDGPAGAGKTTVSRQLAERLGYAYVDTGALYRAVAYEAVERGIASDDDGALGRLCGNLDLHFVSEPGGQRLYSRGVDISDKIRTSGISMMASAVSARPVVRSALLDLQRRLGARKKAVFEGRDMGTVVFPDADVKFFLTADMAVRAGRRYKELAGDPGEGGGIFPNPDYEAVAADMKRRDENDSARQIAPLKPADDAYRIDSTDLSVAQVVSAMMERVRLAGENTSPTED
jgi:cytidylate kinase